MLLNKTIIYLVIVLAAIVLIAELFWAYTSLHKPVSKIATSSSNTIIAQSSASIFLSAPKTALKVGDTDDVTINISSNTPTDGTDIIINYDPKLVEVIPVTNGSPVTVSQIYNQYPNNQLNATKGIIAISGISNEKTGVLANGIFGTMVIKAKAIGKTAISIAYKPGSTDDSNVIETSTGKDVLDKVLNLQLELTQ